jgi:hypothetical protein
MDGLVWEVADLYYCHCQLGSITLVRVDYHYRRESLENRNSAHIDNNGNLFLARRTKVDGSFPDVSKALLALARPDGEYAIEAKTGVYDMRK